MVKAADALAEAGHTVRLVSAQFLDWAAEADRAMGQANGRAWSAVDYRRRTAPAKYWMTGLRFHAARKRVRLAGPGSASLLTLAAANGRASCDLLKLALAEPADLFYGGTCGGLAVAALAARRAGVPYGVDLEDFHEGECENGPAGGYPRDLLRGLQRRVLPSAAFVTAGSSAIAEKYEQAYGVRVLPIHNTFPLPAQAPDPEPKGATVLRLYWFSQTVGAGRGLEDVVRAIGAAGIPAELHLRGSARPEYVAGLRSLASEKHALLAIHVHAPAPPGRMVELSLPYDAGLSPEEGRNLNRELCLSNKALTYILAGLAVVLSDTVGQRSLAGDLGEGALRYKPGDIGALADGLQRWAGDRDRLRRARQAAWQAAQRRWHWEHAQEKGALIEAVEGALP
jgi:glycosyltransferase involved in cell wall biosynthesis